MQLEGEASMAGLSVGSPTLIGFSAAKDTFQRNSNWWTVFGTVELPDFNPSPLWISKRTGIAVEEVVEALEGLVVLGYLKKSNDTFESIKGKDFVPFDWSNKSKAQIVDEHAVVSQQILNDLSPERLFAFEHRFIAGNTELLVELYNDIRAAFEKANAKSLQDKAANDKLFKITFTGVNVLNDSSTKERSQ